MLVYSTCTPPKHVLSSSHRKCCQSQPRSEPPTALALCLRGTSKLGGTNACTNNSAEAFRFHQGVFQRNTFCLKLKINRDSVSKQTKHCNYSFIIYGFTFASINIPNRALWFAKVPGSISANEQAPLIMWMCVSEPSLQVVGLLSIKQKLIGI